jgi:hypothetical protein
MLVSVQLNEGPKVIRPWGIVICDMSENTTLKELFESLVEGNIDKSFSCDSYDLKQAVQRQNFLVLYFNNNYVIFTNVVCWVLSW